MSYRVLTPDIRNDRNAFCRALSKAVDVGLDGHEAGMRDLMDMLGIEKATTRQRAALQRAYIAAFYDMCER